MTPAAIFAARFEKAQVPESFRDGRCGSSVGRAKD